MPKLTKRGRRKSLVGWIDADNKMKFDGIHKFSEVFIPQIFRTKDGFYFHNNVTRRNKYLYCPIKVRITIQEIPITERKGR